MIIKQTRLIRLIRREFLVFVENGCMISLIGETSFIRSIPTFLTGNADCEIRNSDFF